MRLYDKLLSHGPILAFNHAETGWTVPSHMLKGFMMSSVRFDITNVHEYIINAFSGGKVIKATDAPSVKPPFEVTWFEYHLIGMNEISGVLALSYPGFRDVVEMFHFISTTDDEQDPVGPFAMSQIHMDAGGGPTGHSAPMVHDSYRQQSIADSKLNSLVTLNSCAVAMAISFMHCKNVTLEDAPPVGTRQQRRYAERKGIPQTQFKTLAIEPMKQVLRTEGGIEQHGLKKALHICRGHFAHYSEDRPLFGKYTGTFWRPAHVRGSAEAGTVYKDYKVKPSKG